MYINTSCKLNRIPHSQSRVIKKFYDLLGQPSYISFERLIMLYGPRQANLVLIAYASSEVQASLRIRAVSPEPPLLAHTSSESRGTFRQKARSLAPLNGWACAVEICHDGMLEDTNSLDGAHMLNLLILLKKD